MPPALPRIKLSMYTIVYPPIFIKNISCHTRRTADFNLNGNKRLRGFAPLLTSKGKYQEIYTKMLKFISIFEYDTRQTYYH